VRIGAALALAVAVLAACGGDGDDGPADAAGPTITSDDGRASLTLPAGVDGSGLTVSATDVEGSAVAYDLLPADTRFSAPATLTIARVTSPMHGSLPFAISIDGPGAVEALTVDATYETDEPVADVEMPIGHFGTAVVWYPGGNVPEQLLATGLATPDDVVVDEPFDVTVNAERLRTRFVVPRDPGEIVVDVGLVLTSGEVSAENAKPSEVRDLPPQGPLSEFRGDATFTCEAPGEVAVTWLLHFDIESRATRPDGTTTDRLSNADLRLRKDVPCIER
jgi:hypothetical protein